MSIGIYIITNVVTGKHYIGQSINLKNRMRDHRYTLRGNRHCNKYLQASWNKHGEASFTFDVLEYCAINDLVCREIEWTNFFKSAGLYNIGTIESPMLGRKHTKETIEKMRVPKSQETRQKIARSLKGRTFSAEHKEKIGTLKRKTVVFPNLGVTFNSIKEAAAFLGVHTVNLSNHLHGRTKTCKGEIAKFGELLA